MKKNSIALGLILVIVGLIILLKNFGLLLFSWWTIWKVWPFSFIFIGIGIMPIKKIWKGLFYILFIVVCVATMVYVSKNNDYSTWKERLQAFFDKENLKEFKDDIIQSDQISYFGFSDDVTHIKINAEFISGKYIFETKPHKSMLYFSFQGNSYTTSVSEIETIGFLNLYPKTWNNRDSDGKIYLYEDFSYIFNLRGEKSDLSLNAINLKIDTLNIVVNEASTWYITFSKLVPETYIFINAHPDVDNLELTLPDHQAISLQQALFRILFHGIICNRMKQENISQKILQKQSRRFSSGLTLETLMYSKNKTTSVSNQNFFICKKHLSSTTKCLVFKCITNSA